MKRALLRTLLIAFAVGCVHEPRDPKAAGPPAASVPEVTRARDPADTHVSPSKSIEPHDADPCERAAAARERAATLFEQGKLHRTLRVLASANEGCEAQRRTSWALEVRALADIGRYAEARKLAETILESAAIAPAEAVAAARRAKELVTRELDAPRPSTTRGKNDRYERMITVFGRAEALQETNPEEAERLFLEAWDIYHPNGEALAYAARMAKQRGLFAEAQALFDRAVEDMERKTLRDGAPQRVEIDLPNRDDWSRIFDVAWSKDASLLGIASDRGLAVLDARKSWVLSYRVPDLVAEQIAFRPESHEVAASELTTGALSLRDFATERQRVIAPSGSDGPIAFSSDGRTLFQWIRRSGRAQGPLRRFVRDGSGAFRPPDEPLASRLAGHIRAATLSPNGRYVLACIGEGARPGAEDDARRALYLAPVESGKPVKLEAERCERNEVGKVHGASFDATGKRVLVAHHATWKLYGVETGAVLASFPRATDAAPKPDAEEAATKRAPREGAPSVCAGGGLLSSALTRDGTVTILKRLPTRDVVLCMWDDQGGELSPIRLPAPAKTVIAHPVERQVAVFADSEVSVWDLSQRKEIHAITGFVPPLKGTLRVERAEANVPGECRAILQGGYKDVALALRFTADGRLLRLRRTEDAVVIEDLAARSDEGRILHRHAATLGETSAGALDGAGNVYALGMVDGALLGDAPSNRLAVLPDAHDATWPNPVALSPSGELAATLAPSRHLVVWSTRTGREVRRIRVGHAVTAMSFRDEATLDVAAWASARTWSLPASTPAATEPQPGPILLRITIATGAASEQRLKGRRCIATAIGAGPDGRTIAVGFGAETVLVEGDRETQVIKSDASTVRTLAWSGDGRLVAAGFFDGVVRVFQRDGGALLATVRTVLEEGKRVAGYAFTPPPNSLVDFFGDARTSTFCRVGTVNMLVDACEERFSVPGLVGRIARGERLAEP